MKHGLFHKNRKLPRFYLFWIKMRQKCLNPKNRNYKTFGAKGIKICDRWKEFIKFKEDMFDSFKKAEKKYGKNFFFSRINDKKDFTPDNCTFLDKEKFLDILSLRQAKNTVMVNGHPYSISRLNRKIGHNLGNRIKNGTQDKYLLWDKLPYHQKKVSLKVLKKRKFFREHKNFIRSVVKKKEFKFLDERYGEVPHSVHEIGKKYKVSGQHISHVTKELIKYFQQILIN
jgi:hypothetical protein